MRARRSAVRWGIFAAGLAASVLLTVLFWPHGFFLAFVLPFLPFIRLGKAPAERRCARCGWTTRDEGDRFCPRDGEALAAPVANPF